MKNNVTYEKQMRERAIGEQKGLFTIDLIRAGKTPGKLGGRITMQGPISAEEEEEISAFLVKFMEERAVRVA